MRQPHWLGGCLALRKAALEAACPSGRRREAMRIAPRMLIFGCGAGRKPRPARGAIPRTVASVLVESRRSLAVGRATPDRSVRPPPRARRLRRGRERPRLGGSRSPVPSLFVIRGNDVGSRFELPERAASLGRDAANAIQLHDHEVSRRHAELVRRGEEFWLLDLGSSNGCYVNGKRVEQQPLRTGDHVQLGGTLMLFTAQPEPAADLRGQIDLAAERPGDSSLIVRSIDAEERRGLVDALAGSEVSPFLERTRSHLQVMYRTTLAVSQTLDIDQLLHRILELIFEWVEAERGCILLIDPETQRLQPRARRDRQSSAAGPMRISQTILDYALVRSEGVLTSDARSDRRFDAAASIVQQRVSEAICVPMRGRYDLIGAIYLDTSTPPEQVIVRGAAPRFTEEHLKLLVAIAHQAALAVEDTRHYSALVQAERLAAMGQTIAVLSHHIKNVLQGIRGGSYLIEKGLDEHDENLTRKGWKIVEKNQEKISNLVLDMLTFSKEREPDLRAASLNGTVAEVLEVVQARAAERRVELAWTPAPGVPELTFDAEALHRAVLNVVTNAIDACEAQEGPRWVRVATQHEASSGRARIVVEDNGPGIPPEEQERIFSFFVSSKGARGTGLGLPVSQKILQEHGGGIRVESAPGQGSRFILEWPALLAEPEAANLKDTGLGGRVSHAVRGERGDF